MPSSEITHRSASPETGSAVLGSSRSNPSNMPFVIRISESPVTIAGSRDSGSLPLMMTRSAGASGGRQPARSKRAAAHEAAKALFFRMGKLRNGKRRDAAHSNRFARFDCSLGEGALQRGLRVPACNSDSIPLRLTSCGQNSFEGFASL